MENILREVLANDKSLLIQRDKLIAILDEKVPGSLMMEYSGLKTALQLNIGETFASNLDLEEKKAEAAKRMSEAGMQEEFIEDIINTFVKALDLDKLEPKPEPEEKIIPDDIVDDSDDDNDSKKEEEEKFPTPSENPPENIKTSRSPLNLSRPVTSSSQNQPTPPPFNPPPPPPPTPPVNNQSGGNSKILWGIIGVLVLALIFTISDKSDDDSNSSNTPVNSQTTESQNNDSITQAIPSSESQPQSQNEDYRNAQTELSLNGMDLGISLDQVRDKLGRENSMKPEGDSKRYYFDDLEVVIKNNEVIAFVTDSNKYKTFRGLSAGASYSDVLNAYGAKSNDNEYEGYILHEYPFKSINGKNGLLRFAVKKSDNRVDYISIRIIDDEIPPSRPNNNNNDNNINDNVKQAAIAFNNFHDAVTNRNFDMAYSLMTERRRRAMGVSRQTLAKGYTNTLVSQVTDLRLVTSSPVDVTFNYRLLARDRVGDRILVQIFDGQVDMLKDSDGTWKIDRASSSKVSEHYE